MFWDLGFRFCLNTSLGSQCRLVRLWQHFLPLGIQVLCNWKCYQSLKGGPCLDTWQLTSWDNTPREIIYGHTKVVYPVYYNMYSTAAITCIRIGKVYVLKSIPRSYRNLKRKQHHSYRYYKFLVIRSAGINSCCLEKIYSTSISIYFPSCSRQNLF